MFKDRLLNKKKKKTLAMKIQYLALTSLYKKSLFVKFHNWILLFIKNWMFSAHTHATPSTIHNIHHIDTTKQPRFANRKITCTILKALNDYTTWKLVIIDDQTFSKKKKT